MNDGESVFAGGVKLESDSPWLGVLRAGMLFEAYGYWEGDTFVADSVNVLTDDAWSYYQGPASLLGQGVAEQGYSTVEAWTKTDQGLEALQAAESEGSSVHVVAYYDGTRLLAVPGELPPPPAGLSQGWVELVGNYDGQTVTWTSSKAFP